MKVGAAQIDITPPARRTTELSGFVARVQPATGIHDPLTARALYLKRGKQQLLWLHADLIGFEADDVAVLQRTLKVRFGLAAHETCVSATHTHSGPPTIRLLNCGTYDAEYVSWLMQRLVAVAADALGAPRAAESVIGESLCDLAVDRRGKPTKHTDPRMGVIAWRAAQHSPASSPGSYLAVLAKYAMHNVALGPENRLVSADMAGRAAAVIRASLPGQPVVLFTNGGAGNLNPPEVTSDFARMEQWGDQLATSVLAALDPGGPATRTAAGAAPSLRTASTTVALPDVPMTPAGIEETAGRHIGYIEAQTDYVATRIHDAVQQWRTCMLAEVPRQAANPTTPLPIQAIAIGPVVFVAFGAEVFSVAADELRNKLGLTGDAPAGQLQGACRLYVVGYANGDTGYLAPRSAYAEGGYETEGAFLFYGRRPAAPGGFELALEQASRLIHNMVD